MIGKPARNKKLIKGIHISPKTEFKKGFIPWSKGIKLPYPIWNKGKIGVMQMAKRELSPHWRGGKSGENRLIRMSVQYQQWREAIFQRDNYTCVWCGQRGGNLQADHIKPFAYFPKLRFDLNNGRTLCKSCHLKTDTWGIKAKKFNLVGNVI